MSLYTYRATVVRVVDGDTCMLSIDLGFHVTIQRPARLRGINAPEKHGATKAEAEKAAAHLFGLTVAKRLTIQTHLDKNDKYGRILVELFDGDTNINQKMIQDGNAVPFMVR